MGRRIIRKIWKVLKVQKKFVYAQDITYRKTMEVLEKLMQVIEEMKERYS